jgi:hypothetical protein
MRTVKLFFFIFISFFSNSQSSHFNEDSIKKYFLVELDSFRKGLYPSVPDVIVNENASIACKHHNEYMTNMVKPNYFFCSHGEFQSDKGFTYVGSDTLISNFANRIKYYNTNKDFSPYGEVIVGEFLNLYIKNKRTNEYLAKNLFLDLKESSEHNKILSNFGYNVVAIDVKIFNNIIYVTMVVGVIIEKSEDGKIVIIKNKI